MFYCPQIAVLRWSVSVEFHLSFRTSTFLALLQGITLALLWQKNRFCSQVFLAYWGKKGQWTIYSLKCYSSSHSVLNGFLEPIIIRTSWLESQRAGGIPLCLPTWGSFLLKIFPLLRSCEDKFVLKCISKIVNFCSGFSE